MSFLVEGDLKRKKYFIKKSHINFIKENIKKSDFVEIFDVFTNEEYENNKFFSVYLTKEEVDSLLDELTMLFTEKGIDQDSEPNQFGLLIEELIDKFSKK